MAYGFSELNFDKSSTEHSGKIDICIFNHYQASFREAVKALKACLERDHCEYTITVLDTSGYFKDGDRLSEFIKENADIKIFLPSQGMHLGEMINLYVRKSKSNYLLMLSSDLRLSRFAVDEIDKTYQRDAKVMGVFPHVEAKGLPINTVYKISDPAGGPFISFEPYRSQARSLVPYKFSFFFARDFFLSVNGMDCEYEDFFMECLDLGYRLYLQEHVMSGCEGFLVEESGDEGAFHASLNKARDVLLKAFRLKNVFLTRPRLQFSKELLSSLFTGRWHEIEMLRKFFKKRKMQEELKMLSDQEVVRLLETL